MASNFEPLTRTKSAESDRSPSSFNLLRRASSSQHKAKQADIEPSTGEVEHASLSMPPPAIKHIPRPKSLSSNSVRTLDQEVMGSFSGPQDESMLPPSGLSAADGGSVQNSEILNSTLFGSDSQLESTTTRRSEPEVVDMRPKKVPHPHLHQHGKSAPSSVVGSSDHDAQTDSSNKATTATQHLSVTALSQNGALSPTLSSSLKEPQFISSTASSVTPANTGVTSPTSPTSVPSRESRQSRGRMPVPSRQISTSGPSSTSGSMERPTAEKNPNRIGTIGICALDSKARSKPSRNILNRLMGKDNDFDVVIFGDKVILDEDVENWPVCDFLISFFSEGFPLEKAIAYAKLRRPFCVNDVPMQTVLWDRRLCLTILDQLGVPTPPRLEVSRDGGPVTLSTDISKRLQELTTIKMNGPEGRGGDRAPPKDIHMEDDNDTLVVDGRRLSKPFVEKPVSGEDHNINIYYPRSQGGGGRRLFRKVNNKSSEKDETLIVPCAISDPESSYVYEQFLKVENAEDVKAYTVGPDFCHAETRKSPVVDGVVKRNPSGKEVRYITSLTKEEQTMASKIANGFGQRVCGFDLLRVGDSSYVIDVNGWSFVKDNNEYYDKCASILKAIFLREKMRKMGALTPGETDDKDYSFPPVNGTDGTSATKKAQAGKGDAERGSHRSALKHALRSRSISQLREHVSQAAHKMGHPSSARSPSGATSPMMTSPPTIERSDSWQKNAPTSIPKHDSLPPPAGSHLNLKGMDEPERPASANGIEEPQTAIDAPTVLPAPAMKSQWKLKGMVAVIRHADRTPKQKFKFTFHSKVFVDLLKGHQEEVLLVGEAALKSVQIAVKEALDEGLEDVSKLRILQNALAKKGSWPGTKVQIKPMFKKPKSDKDGSGKENKKSKHEDHASVSGGPITAEPATGSLSNGGDGSEKTELGSKGETVTPGSSPSQQRSNSVGEVTLSRAAAADNNLVLDKLQLVMKWGGEPTHSARYQAAELGDNMRNDLLLMNREVLTDVRIFTSSERRVTTSAQIFAGSFMNQRDVEDHHVRVRKDLLDDSNAAKDEMDKVKKKLKGLLRQGYAVPEQFAWPKNTPEPYVVVRNVVDLMKFHRRVMRHNFAKLQTSDAVSSLERMKSPSSTASDADSLSTNGGSQTSSSTSSIQSRWCTGEDADLFKERWEKLFNEFTDPEKVDPSKISELYDTMKFDALHNRQFLEWIFTPSQSILREDEDEDMSKLTRTESVVAREEYAQTHNGVQPTDDAKGEHEIKPIDKSSRSGTASTVASNAGPANDRERHSFSHKIGRKRRSVDLKTIARTAMAGESAEDSYFNLYKGDGSAAESKFRSDIRLEKLNELYGLSKILFDFIGPQEYGITDSEKLEIGLLTSLPLLREIVTDLEEVQAADEAKSFIYFTKESHIYTLLNCILEGGVQTKIARNAIPELDYLSQICFELYESENAEADIDPSNPDSNFNYSIRISISPGCHTFDPLDVQLDSKHCIGNAPRRTLTPHGNWKDVLATLRAKFHTVQLPKSFVAINLSEKIPQEFAKGELGEGEEDVVTEASPIAPAH